MFSEEKAKQLSFPRAQQQCLPYISDYDNAQRDRYICVCACVRSHSSTETVKL
jgi:hypothetical protein